MHIPSGRKTSAVLFGFCKVNKTIRAAALEWMVNESLGGRSASNKLICLTFQSKLNINTN